jgi:hypothetical protein
MALVANRGLLLKTTGRKTLLTTAEVVSYPKKKRMAIYGIGASYSQEDVSQEFIRKGLAYVGWSEADAPPLHAVLRHFKVGDVVYIKAHPPSVGLIINCRNRHF